MPPLLSRPRRPDAPQSWIYPQRSSRQCSPTSVEVTSSNVPQFASAGMPPRKRSSGAQLVLVSAPSLYVIPPWGPQSYQSTPIISGSSRSATSRSLKYIFVRKTVRLPNGWCPWSQFRLALYPNSTLLTNLHRLDIWRPLDSGTKSLSAKDMVSALIRNRSDMIAMEIHCPQRLETTVRLINECKKLQELWVAFVMDMRSAKKLMDHAPESIRKLRLRVSKELGHHESVDQVSGVDAMNVSASMPFHSHPYLESLEISGNFQGWEEYLFLPFLTTCGTNLKDFRSRHTDCFRLKKLREDLFRAGASLEYLIPLQLPNYRSSSDSAVADTIVHHKRLHIIDLSYCNAAGPLTANAIVNCGKRLRSLRVPGCTKPSSKNLTSILGAASNMRHWVRHFVARTKAYDAAKDSYILARDLISTEWNAPFLVSFECRLKVPQPNEQARYGAVDQTMNHPSIRDCRAIQRAVYRQIARQKNLTHLDLGQSARCSLAMTLQSGLDELATLKKIRHLYVEYMNHWIGVPELEWMSNNWPQLDFICGPFKNGQNCDPAVIEWLMVNKPEWK